jgi:hypothetical protein
MTDNVVQIDGRTSTSPTEAGRQRKLFRRKTKPERGDLRYGRMAVANNNGLLPDTDGRMGFARRYKQIVSTIVNQCGGIERCDEVRLQSIRRFAAVSCLAEQIEAKAAAGEKINIAEHATLSSVTVRLSNKIGITHNAKNISDITPPSPAEYFKWKQQQRELSDNEC